MNEVFQGIDAVILDLGGVILNIDYQLTINAFEALGFANFHAQYSQLQQSGLFDDLETGKMDPDRFVANIQAFIPHASATAIIKAWNALLLDFPEGRIETVQSIARRYPTFLLSNTNAIHYEAFNHTLFQQTGLNDIKPLFQKAYLSHEIHARKPDAKAFELILNEQGLKAKQVLFVDDSPQHIAAAQNLGIKAVHLVAPHTLEQLFAPVLTELD
jgi:FMN phosphatase YigB (HAD superfamily)